ncbi:LCP family protein [Microbacterium sp. No. 7]|uniref:LCP family protein n=1 Tax=Microbacterium sp. No. 7 TaxID=1714373 RepID=UPI0006ED3A68|nr:LCP family protein [Microbacterium sp. No. 7]ALJ18932.1 transcriptional regulator [Microbacterium sp. No. 7]
MSPRKAPRHRPVARHGILTQPHPLVQLLTVLGAAVVVVVLSTSLVGAFTVWDAARAVEETSVDIGTASQDLPAVGEIEGGVNLLLVGTDSCEGQDLALFPRCAEDEGGERNDVTMLVHISDEPRRVTVVSFPRDMIVDIPSCTDADGNETYPSTDMLNASYFYGGLACSAKTISELTGVEIQYAAAIRWTGVINMSDAIGGVDVCVSGEISDTHTGLHLTEGHHTLQGAEALQFLRIRHGIGDGSDLGRISNQQQFMSSLVRKLQSDGVLNNPQVLYTFATTALKQVNSSPPQLLVSSSLANPWTMVQIAMAVRSVPFEDIVFVQYPTVYAEGGMRVLPVVEDADVLFAALAENQSLMLTGGTSGGYGTEVVGDAQAPGESTATPTPTEPDADGEPVEGEPGEDGTVEEPPVTEEPTVPAGTAVLPGSITGQTALQVTCTVPE